MDALQVARMASSASIATVSPLQTRRASLTFVNEIVCSSTSACTAAISAYPDASTRIATNQALSGNQSVSCNTSPYTYTQGFMDCNVQNTALQSIFPGETTLAIQKTVEPKLSLAYPFGSNGTALAQLYYAPNSSTPVAEQFYCQAGSCAQTLSSGTTLYSCADLTCTCITGAAFCGGQAGGIDLTTTIGTMTGPLDISCVNSTNCNFKQALLIKLFGQSGLGLGGCAQGECVREDIRAALEPSDSTSSGGNSLAPGVIAGLAVVGALFLLLLSLLVFGYVRQRKAAKSYSPLLHAPKQVGVAWQQLSYTLPTSSLAFLKRSKAQPGKVILDGLNGSIPCGSFLCVLGPSGAGKRRASLTCFPYAG
jgi:ABC-type multidrug transport system fused ATPase/permease subunit